MIEPGVLHGDGDITGDGGEQFEVIARKIIAINCFAKTDDGSGAIVETAGDEIIQVELLDRAADRFAFIRRGARRFEKQAAALERRTRRIEKAEIERTRRPESHRTRKHKLGGMRGILEKDSETIDQ